MGTAEAETAPEQQQQVDGDTKEHACEENDVEEGGRGSPTETTSLLEHQSTCESIKPLLGVRIPVLLFICLLTFGNYFMYDIPGALGWGVECSLLDADSVQCYDSPLFNALGPPNKNYCDPYTITTNLTQSSSCQISYDESMFTDTTAGSCMADCWRTHPDWSVYGVQTVDRLNNFTLCFCAEDLPASAQQKLAAPTDCNVVCSGVEQETMDHGDLSNYCGAMQYMTVGRYQCEIQTIEMHFRRDGKKYTNTQNLALYSVYGYTSAVLALCGGVLIDKLGVRTSSLVFIGGVLVGNALLAVGVQAKVYWLMVVGQTIFGLGGECLTVAQTTYTVRWFQNTGYMAFAMGITLSFSRIGSSGAFALLPWLAAEREVTSAIWFGVGMCFLSFVMTVVLWGFDYWAEHKRPDLVVSNPETDQPFRLRDLKKFGLEVWFCTFVIVAFYCTIYPFNGIAKNFFHDKWGITLVQAGTVVSAYTFFAAGVSPIVGFAVDRAGRALVFVLVGVALSPIIHTCMWLLPASQGSTVVPVILMLGIGLTLTMVSCTAWPAAAYVVDHSVLGSTYGLITALQNLGIAVIPTLVGHIRDTTQQEGNQSYYYCIYLFIGCGLAAVLVCTIWLLYHKKYGSSALLVNAAARDEIMVNITKQQEKQAEINKKLGELKET